MIVFSYTVLVFIVIYTVFSNHLHINLRAMCRAQNQNVEQKTAYSKHLRTEDGRLTYTFAALSNITIFMAFWLSGEFINLLDPKSDHLIPKSGLRWIIHKVHVLYTSKLSRIEELYRLKGVFLMIVLRNIPVIRSIASYPAGRVRMPLLTFLGASYVGIQCWVLLWTVFGYFLGNIANENKWHVAVGVVL